MDEKGNLLTSTFDAFFWCLDCLHFYDGQNLILGKYVNALVAFRFSSLGICNMGWRLKPKQAPVAGIWSASLLSLPYFGENPRWEEQQHESKNRTFGKTILYQEEGQSLEEFYTFSIKRAREYFEEFEAECALWALERGLGRPLK
jgi:hypothetical protein